VRAVYSSGTIALAALEMLAHVDPEDAPDDMVVIPADIPDDLAITEVALRSLPGSWRSFPAPPRLQQIGLDWVRGGRTAVLSVPSVLVPQERNYLLNPDHPDFRRIKRGKPKAFAIDPRFHA